MTRRSRLYCTRLPARKTSLRVENLAERTLPAGSLTASLNTADGILRIEGIEGDDVVHVRYTAGNVRIDGITIRVTDGASVTNPAFVARGKIARIDVAALGGNDLVQMHDSVGADQSPIPMFIHGNAGNDTLLGGNGDDLIFGDSGTDSILGGAGKDLLLGHDTAAAIPPTVSYYKADGNATDSNGSNNGSLFGNTTFAGGKDGQAFDFDGTQDYVDLGSDPSLNLPGNLSVSLWVRLDAANKFKYLLADFDATGYVSQGSLGTLGKDAAFFWYQSYTNGTGAFLVGNTPIQLNNWYFVTAVRDDAAKTVRLYVNGHEEGSINYTGKTIVPLQRSKLLGGAGLEFPTDYMDGQLDEIRVFGRALSPSEIQAIYLGGTLGAPDDAAPDVISGQAGDDTIYGAGGNDVIRGNAGNDWIDAGEGNDWLAGESGTEVADLIRTGNDTLLGGVGDDTLRGGQGKDRLEGEDGGDVMFGGDENDTVVGGNNNDLIYGDGGNDMLIGCYEGWGGELGNADDTIHGGNGDDALYGGDGNDHMYGENGNDFLKGDDGNDELVGCFLGIGTERNGASDTIYGGNGSDNLFGGDGADFMVGENDSDFLKGDNGNDTLIGCFVGWGGELGNADDTLYGGAGRDSLFGGDGNDRMAGEDGGDFLKGDNGDDYLIGCKVGIGNEANGANDVIWGGDGNDSLFGGDGNDNLVGDAGNDFIKADNGDDVADGGAGDDYVLGGLSNDDLSGGDGNDTLVGEQGLDSLHGGTGDDILWGAADGNSYTYTDRRNELFGDENNDRLYGGNASDYMSGGPGNDGLFGGKGGPDNLFGDDGADRFLVRANGSVLVQDKAPEDVTLTFADSPAGVEKNPPSNWPSDPKHPYRFDAGTWTAAEIATADEVFGNLMSVVNNNSLLRFPDGTEYTFTRRGQQTDGPIQADGLPFRYGGQNFGNGNISIAQDIRATLSLDTFRHTLYHELGHSRFNNDQPDAAYNMHMQAFRDLSGWTRSANQPYFGAVPSDGVGDDWWYNGVTAQFALPYGQTSPDEDWATTWETYFMDRFHGNQGDNNKVPAKLALIATLLDDLRT